MSNSAIAIRMTAVSVFLKMLVFTMNWQQTNYEKVYFFANVFILMSGIFFGIRNFKKSEPAKTEFIADFKAGMKVAALYSIFMAAFVFIYYKIIDVEYFINKLEMQLELARENNMNLQNAREMGEFALSAFFQSTVTLVGFLILGSFYSGILAFLMRKLKMK